MKSHLAIFKSFGIYTAAGILGRVASFLLLPFFTHYLTESDYGTINIFSNSIYFLTPFMAVGIGETFAVEYPRFSKDEMKNFISTSFCIPLIVFVLGTLVLLIFREFFIDKTGLSLYLLFLVALLSVSNFFTEYIFIVFRNQNNPIAYGLFSLFKTILELFLAVLFIKYLHKGYMGRIDSLLFTSLFGFLFIIVYFVSNNMIGFTFSKKWISVILHRGVPTIPLFFMIFTLGNADKYILNYYYGKDIVGLYGLGWQFAMIITMVVTAFMTPFYPFLYQKAEGRDYGKVITIIMLFLGGLMVCILLFLLVLPVFFNLMIGHNFHSSLQFIPYMLLGQFFWAIFLIACGYIYYKRRNYIFYYLSPMVIVFTIVIDYLFLVRYPVQNFAMVSFFSYLLCFFLQLFFLRRDIRRLMPVFQTTMQSFIKRGYEKFSR